MGPVVLDRLVRPIVRGVHSADPDDLPLDQVAPGLRGAMLRTGSLARGVLEQRAGAERAGSAVAGIRGGVNRIVEELAADLQRFGVEVRLGSRVTAVEPGRVTVGEESIEGTVLVAAPGLLGDAADRGRRVVLATLVVDEPRLDAAPRGTGVLVAEGAPGIRARALTHATAKWQWLAERAEGRHVLRLSYDGDADSVDGVDGDLAELARRDASALLGVEIAAASVVDFARAEWYRPKRMTHTPDGILAIGETIAGTGLAAIVGQAEAAAAKFLRDGAA
jgi:oxygen-dependent protoporphyrinogen oxidase